MINSEFLITSLVVVLIPGTGVIYTLSNGLFLGRRASFLAAFGCTIGIIPHLLASTLGLSVILHMSAVVFQIIKFAGVAYLLFFAWLMWRDSGVLTVSRSKEKKSWEIVIKGFLINILNPKLSLFFLAFLPQFLPVINTSPIPYLLLLSSVFMGMTFVVFVFYGLFANHMRVHVIHSPKIVKRIQKSFAVIFAILAGKLALTEQ